MRLKKLSRDFALEASGVDLARPLSDAAFREIEEAFFAGQVLVFRGQKLTAREFLEFARRFGPPEPHVVDQFHHPEYADILILSNVVRDGKPAGLADAGTYFHTDYSYLEMPARATLLHSIQVPRAGGDTLFANQYSAYDDLPGATKKRLQGLIGLHHYGNRDDLEETSRTAASQLTEEQKARLRWVRHPVARAIPSRAARRSTPSPAARSASRACPSARRARCSTSSSATPRSRSTGSACRTASATW